MSEYPQPGPHPDPDTLNAFVEAVLPEHERLACLAHFADCAACREVVYFTQEPLPLAPDPVADRVAWWKRGLKPIPALSAAAVAGILVLSIALYRIEKPAPSAPIAVVAESAAKSAPQVAYEVPAPNASRAASGLMTPRAAPKLAPHLDNPKPVSPDALLRLEDSLPVTQPARSEPAALDVLPNNGSLNPRTAITGTITDPTGAVVAGAAVTARPASGAPAANAVTDNSGQFLIAGLQPGQYELRMAQSGFQTATKKVEVQPGQLARADSSLLIGSAAESVTVTGSVNTASPSVTRSNFGSPAVPLFSRMAARKTATAGIESVSLPSKLAAIALTTKNQITLAADSAGTLYRRDDAGKRWEAVNAVWQGKVVELGSDPPPVDAAVFRLKTDSGTAWLSRDGAHWFPASQPPR